ncbi:hypothetical protein CAPTEDRAFT_177616 [Capitella teleta]|uniref:1-alkyl-2-acetylglycerophosphocholine esterase n=1 Tax=Capitella teleta TaxID=283909 RepID=R7U5M4_CAPTE|nr:hypothetical protein CAPTEDRAFT_177616 [Capitella teleta]|eukprot:ELT98440.1 hypothetical protein CAPTEDRAFT_177616 [Capitella teleta]
MPRVIGLKRLRSLKERITPHGRRHLPLGSGPYTVGCVDVMTDHSVAGLFLRLYYPTNSTDAQWPLWLPNKKYGNGYVYFRRKNTKIFGTILNWVGGDMYVPVLWQAPVLETEEVAEPFPVVLFTHGLGGNRTTYSTLCSDIASNGFIVAAIEHRDGSASMTYCFKQPACNDTFLEEEIGCLEAESKEDDFNIRNKQVQLRVTEIQRLLDFLETVNAGREVRNVLGHHFDLRSLKGRLDMSKVSVVGHSFGASTAIATLASGDQRVKCGVALDGWMLPLDQSVYSEVTAPLLMVNTESFQWKDNVRPMYRFGVNGDDEKMRRLLITIRGTCHQSQSDFQFMVPGRIGRMLEVRHTLEPRVAMDLNNKATLGFLAKHLDIPNCDHHDDILLGENPLVIQGTNLDLNSDD